jgi:hypothetical protein
VLDRLPEDWRARYGYAPVLGRLSSSVVASTGMLSRRQLAGIAVTRGAGRQDAAHQTAGARKTVWSIPDPDFRRVLREVPQGPVWHCCPWLLHLLRLHLRSTGRKRLGQCTWATGA